MLRRIATAAIAAVLLSATAATHAATRTWSGAVSTNWGTAINWAESVVPVNGDDLVFPDSPTNRTSNNNIAGLSVAVWAHHMYVTGAVLLPFFALMTMLIAVPTGVKFFNWIGTMWRGSLSFETPMLWTIGFLVTFLFGGLTGIILAMPPLDFPVSDSYFVVAHFHYTVFGTVVFMMFAGFYFWWPKWTGRMLDERLGKVHFWLLFIGFQTTFLVQHWLGTQGMARRYADYLPGEGFQALNIVSSIGALILGISTLFFLWNVYRTWRYAPKVEVDDPWGWGGSLEWATSCPPPRHNFVSLPPIRSERPAFDLHHPEYAYTDLPVGKNKLDDLVGGPHLSKSAGTSATATAVLDKETSTGDDSAVIDHDTEADKA